MEASDDVKTQIHFTGKSSCTAWAPNRFKATKCSECNQELPDHSADVVSAAQVSDYLLQVSAKDPCNEIFSAANGHGALYLGGFQALSASNLANLDVHYAVQTAKGLEAFFAGWGTRLHEQEKAGSVTVLRMNWVDGAGQLVTVDTPWDGFIESVSWVHDKISQGHNVVVNCAQGKSRSTTVVVAYLMVTRSWGFSETLSFVRTKRAIAEPNPSFQRQLQEFRHSHEFTCLQATLGIK